MTNDFDKKGYAYLKEFLDIDNCKDLTNILKELVAQGETIKDSQCPISEAIHGNLTFDKLLMDLLPYVEQATNKRLFPTYSFARLYKPGEELKKHTDRPACEISVTITLGFEGNPWAIYMDGTKIEMNVGDAVVYKGNDIEHWREKYTEGQWQAQIFLHYVDADGSHADQKYDGRQSLGLKKPSNSLPSYSFFPKHISDSFCNNLITTCVQDTIPKEPPIIGGHGENETIDRSVRDVERVPLPDNVGMGATLTASGLSANQSWWKYTITHSNQTELLIYKPDGHYNAHVDTFHSHDDETRKLTVLAFLNDDYEGGKFFLNANGNITYPPQEKGTVIVFPSYMVHGVEPVTKGIRYSCVTWLVGPYFK